MMLQKHLTQEFSFPHVFRYNFPDLPLRSLETRIPSTQSLLCLCLCLIYLAWAVEPGMTGSTILCRPSNVIQTKRIRRLLIAVAPFYSRTLTYHRLSRKPFAKKFHLQRELIRCGVNVEPLGILIVQLRSPNGKLYEFLVRLLTFRISHPLKLIQAISLYEYAFT